MGFRNNTCGLLFLVLICLFAPSTKAQEVQNIDLDYFYNEWALSESESDDELLVYRDEDDFIFDGIKYNQSKNLKFTSYNKILFLVFPKYEKRPERCGNGLKHSKYRLNEGWRKGIWDMEQEGDNTFLILEYFKAKKGEKYTRTDMLDYQILYLSEDKMVLQQLTKWSIN